MRAKSEESEKELAPASSRAFEPGVRTRVGAVGRVALSIMLVAGLSIDPNIAILSAFGQDSVASEAHALEAQASTETVLPALSEKGVHPLSSSVDDGASLLLSSTTWGGSEDTFSITMEAAMPLGSMNNVVVVKLPRYISLVQEIIPNEEKGIKQVSVSNPADDPNGVTTIIFELVDAVRATVAGTDLIVSQAAFIKEARETTTGLSYDITAEWTRDGAAVPISVSKSFRPDTLASRLTATPFFSPALIDVDNPTNRLNVTLRSRVDLGDDTPNLEGEVSIPKDQIENFYDVDDPDLIDEHGDLVVPYSVDQHKTGPTAMQVELPVTLNKQKLAAYFYKQGKSSLTFDDAHVSFLTRGGTKGKSSTLSNSLMFPIMGFGSTELNSNFSNVSYSVNGYDIGLDGSFSVTPDLRVWKPYFKSSSSSDMKFAAGTGKVDLTTLKDLSMSFSVPDTMEWLGDAACYDARTRTVTIPLAVNAEIADIGYSLTLPGGDPVELKFRLAKTTSNGAAAEYPTSIQVKDVAFNGMYLDSPYVLGKNFAPRITIDLKSTSADLKFADPYKIKTTDTDAVVYSLGRTIPFASVSPALHPVAYQADVDTSALEINHVEVDAAALGKLVAGRKVSFVYTTSSGPAEYTNDLSNDIVLKDNEYLTSWKICFPDGLPETTTSTGTFLTFKGHAANIAQDYLRVVTTLKAVNLVTGEPEQFLHSPYTETIIERVVKITDPLAEIEGDMTFYKNDSDHVIKVGLRRAADNETSSLPDGRMDVQIDLPKHIQVTKLDAFVNSGAPYNMRVTYTTHKNPSPKTEAITAGRDGTKPITLAKGDYFTSIAANMYFSSTSSKLLMTANIDPNYDIVEAIEADPITARVVESNNIAAQEVTGALQMVRRAEATISTKGNGSFNWTFSNTEPYAGTEIEASIKLPFKIKQRGLSASEVDSLMVENPTFYVPLPRWLSYEEGSFAVDGNTSKRPKVTRSSEYLKIEYSGEVSSASGIAVKANGDHTLSMKLRVADFSKRGSQTPILNVYTDLEDGLAALNDEDLQIAYGTGWVEGNYQSVLTKVQDGNRAVQVMSNGTAGSLRVLQYANTVFSVGVATAGDATLRPQATIVAGEEFSAFLDIANYASEMENFTMYIPVARAGRDDGAGVSQWTAQLTGAVTDSGGSGTNVEFSTDDNPTMGALVKGGSDPAGMYVPQTMVSDLSQVTMVKITKASITANSTFVLTANFKSSGDKTAPGDQTNRIVGHYAYESQQSAWIADETTAVELTLTDTEVSGRLWEDVNADGIMDAWEPALPNGRVVLHGGDGSAVREATSDSGGRYSMTVGNLPQGGYLTVDKPAHYMLTHQRSLSLEKERTSSFNQDTYRAELTAAATDNMNAGFVFTQDLSFTPDAYTMRAGNDVQLVWVLDPSDPPRTLTFVSSNEKVAKVDAAGKVTAVAPGTAEIAGSFENDLGFTTKAIAKITVETNDAPVITVPSVVELNKGDAWDPRDASIVTDLAVSDDHDSLQLSDLAVAGDAFAKGGAADAVGTYEVTYTVKDSDGNESRAVVKVKVHGLPYLTDKAGNSFAGGTPPMLYVRFDDGVDPFGKVRAFWEEASDAIGAAAQKREIDVNDTTTGTFKLTNTTFEDGVPTPAITGAGAYKADYYMLTPKGGATYAKQHMQVRGKLNLFANSISVSGTAPKTHFDTFAEFVQAYGAKLNIESSVDVADIATGKVSTLDLKDKVTVKGAMADHDFSLPAGQSSKTVHMTLEVTDATSADTYGTKTKELDIDVTVLNAVGEPPTITFDRLENPLERLASDTVQEDPTVGSPALPDSELYGKLLRDATIEDAAGGTIVSSSIESARVIKGDTTLVIDVNKGASLRRMLTTPGTYELSYKATDNDGNTVTADREIRVAGATKFVTNFGLPSEADAPSMLNFRQRATGMYSPAGSVMAYHIDADGVTRHQEPVTSAGNHSADLRQVGATVLTAQSRHHYWFWPATMLDRPLDAFQQTILVHGPIQFAGDTADVEAFVDETVDVSNVTASFQRAVASNGATPAATVTERLSVAYDTAGRVSASNPSQVVVTYDSHDDVSGSDAGNDATFKRTVSFYGLPQITAPIKIIVPEYANEAAYRQSVLDAINATAKATLPDGTEQTLSASVDTTGLGVLGGKATVSATQKIANGTKSRTATAEVEVVVSKCPVVTASDIELNVGDALDVIAQSGAAAVDDLDVLTTADLNVESSVPVDAAGKVTEAGTTAVKISVADKQGNVGEAVVNVRVNGLPVIDGAPDLIARVGDSLSVWDKITVTWERAPMTPGPAQTVTFKHGDDPAAGTVELTNYRKVEGSTETPVTSLALNNPGLYLGDYVATVPTGTTSTETRTLMLHGKPSVSASSITVAETEKAPASAADFLAKHRNDLAVSATTVHVNPDGTTRAVDLLADGKVELDLSRVQFGVEGSYEAVVNALDEAPGVDARTFSATVDVVIDQFNGVPPRIVTHAVQRVSTDPVLRTAGQSLASYLLTDRFAAVEKKEHEVTSFEVSAIEKISGPSLSDASNGIALDAPEAIDPKDENQLAKMFSSVGSYHITYMAEDNAFNRVSSLATLDVAGPTEFGTMVDGDFVDLGDVVQVRQTAGGEWTPSALRARHQDMDGSYHYVPLDPAPNAPGGTSLEEVKALDVAVSAAHHRDRYEDGGVRPHDAHPFKLLVQGRPEIVGLDQPLTLYQGDTLNVLDGVTATFKRVSADGVVTHGQANLSAVQEPTSDVPGRYRALVRAEDAVTGAPEAMVEAARFVEVNGVPRLEYASSIAVPVNASANDVRKALGARASYASAAGPIEDITDAIVIDQDTLDLSQGGKTLTLYLEVPYTLDPQDSQRTVRGRASVYVDAAPTYSSDNDDFNVGDAFDPLVGVAFADQEDGQLDGAVVTVVENTVDTTVAGTYRVVYSVRDTCGNTPRFQRTVRVHGLPVISGAPSNLPVRVGSLPAEPLTGVTATYLKAGDNVGDAPVETVIQADASRVAPFSPVAAPRLAGLTFGALRDADGSPVEQFKKPGLYYGTYEAASPYGGKSQVQAGLLVHGLPEVASTGLEIHEGDQVPVDIGRLIAETGLKATVEHALPDGAVVRDELPDDALAVVFSDVKAAEPGSYTVRVRATDAVAPPTSTEADVHVTVVAKPIDPEPAKPVDPDPVDPQPGNDAATSAHDEAGLPPQPTALVGTGDGIPLLPLAGIAVAAVLLALVAFVGRRARRRSRR